MATKRDIEKICHQHNKSRNVIEENLLDIKNALVDMKGNFFATGGSEEDRLKIIEELVSLSTSAGETSTIVFTNSRKLKEGLIQLHLKRTNFNMVISGFGYKNYDVFSDISKEQITELIHKVAIEKSYKIDELIPFANGYLSILESVGKLDLALIKKSMDKDINEILSRYQGDSNKVLSDVSTNIKAYPNFRLLINNIWEAFNKILNEEEIRGFTIDAGLWKGLPLMIIQLDSINKNILDSYYRYVLFNIKDSKQKIKIIVDDINLGEKSELLGLFMDLKMEENIELFFISKNIKVLLKEDEYLSGFENYLIMPHSSSLEDDGVTKLLGTYLHYEATISGSTPHRLFISFQKSEQWGHSSNERLRIQSIDLQRTEEHGERIAFKRQDLRGIYLMDLNKFFL